jgi:hypothetical protein
MQALAEYLEHTAEWRREKAAEYPDDERNAEAATLLQQLCEACLDTDPSEQGQNEATYERLARNDSDHVPMERFHDYLGRIGFDHWPCDVEQLCHGLLHAMGLDQEEAA